VETAAYSVDDFCRAHGISRGMFYKLRRQGKAPREMSVGTHIRISKESAADWRREREADAQAPHIAETVAA
jgi:predicted DNA-binding transcriptional regulator AlpA